MYVLNALTGTHLARRPSAPVGTPMPFDKNSSRSYAPARQSRSVHRSVGYGNTDAARRRRTIHPGKGHAAHCAVPDHSTHDLSPRELEVIRLVAKGRTNRQ